MNAEDPLFILYTSGSTGKPKGVLHTSGGYLVLRLAHPPADLRLSRRRDLLVHRRHRLGDRPQLHRLRAARQRRDDADVRGRPQLSRRQPLLAGDRQAQVDIFYTAPTAIRALMGAGDDFVKKTSRKSLRLLGSVGEPINPEAWEWYYRVVGEERCPIVDTWWQTETGGILISPLPGATDLKPGSATRPFFGVQPAVVDADGNIVERRRRGQPGHHQFLARPDAHRLWRPPALHRHLLQGLSRQLLHRRRLPARRRRLLVDHRPRRRRDQRRRPSPRHGGSRNRRWSPTARSPRRRWSATRIRSRARASTPMSR